MYTMTFCPQCTTQLIEKVHSGKVRQLCPKEGCGFVFWNNPMPVVAAIIEYEGNIILARNVGWPETWYGLVTGFLEAGETPEEGIKREIKEELNLDTISLNYIGLYDFFQRNELILAYHAIAVGEIKLNEELADIKRVHPDKLRPWPMGTGKAVADWLAKRKSVA